jgi:hypothetical protein
MYESVEKRANQNIWFALADYFHISINDFLSQKNIKER